MLHKLLFVSALLCTIISCKTASTSKSQKPSRPNLIIFLTDDNDFSYWGFSGGPKLSPHIDKLAEEGIVASQFYANSPVCTPSRYSLHTGKYPGNCASREFFQFNPTDQPYKITWNTPLDPQIETTIGELFQQGGYHTAAVGKWHLSFRVPKFEFDADADPQNPQVAQQLIEYQEAAVEQVKLAGFDYAASIIVGNNDEHPIHNLRVHNLEWTAKGAIDFLNQVQKSNKPFFLLVNISTHHGPCHRNSVEADIRLTQQGIVEGLTGIMPNRSTIAERIKEKGEEVNFKTVGTLWTDDCVGAILGHLRELSLDQNTAVVFTTDHNRYDGKATCYQGGVHIPFVMKYPGHKHATTQVPFQITDLMPTLAEACGVSLPDNLTMDGESVWPEISSSDVPTKKRDFYFEFGYSRAVLSDNWKYIAFRPLPDHIRQMKNGKVSRAFNYKGNTGDEPAVLRYPHYFDLDQLYDLSKDPDEQANLAQNPAYQDILQLMKIKLQKKLSGFKHPFPLEVEEPFFNSQTYATLKANARVLNMEDYYWYQNGCF